jgi:hypothetical protein
MTLVRKIDGAWQVFEGVNEPMARMTDKATIHYADGRAEEVTVAPYETKELLTASAVEGLLASGLWQPADIAPFGLHVAAPFALPEGKRTIGALRIVEIDGVPAEDYDLEDIPPPPVLTAAEKLALSGLSVDELREILGLEPA